MIRAINENKRSIYFDYNATAPLLPAVKEGMYDIMDMPLNPSSLHSYGRKAKHILETARSRILSLVGGIDKYKLIFTSSGTESNNMAITGIREHKVITTTIEHSSILKLVGEGLIPVDMDGLVRLEVLEILLRNIEGPKLLSVQYANNETGVIQPIKEIIKIARKYDALIHTDATQAFGKISISLDELDLDMVTISGHKFGGPIGAAALIFKKNIDIKPLMIGGGQEFRFRPGTQNIAAIHGFGIAAEISANSEQQMFEVELLRDYIDREIMNLSQDAIIFSKNVSRIPNTTLISMPNVSNETQVIHFDINDIAISSGAACSSGKVDSSNILMSMGYSEEVAKSAIRVSLGLNNTKQEANKFIKLWNELYLKTKLIQRIA